MIAKHVSMRVTRKSDFGGLVRYITSAQGRDERVGDITVTNCKTDDPHAAAIACMAVQAQNKRSEADKTYHLIVSFRPGERPTRKSFARSRSEFAPGLAMPSTSASVRRTTTRITSTFISRSTRFTRTGAPSIPHCGTTGRLPSFATSWKPSSALSVTTTPPERGRRRPRR